MQTFIATDECVGKAEAWEKASLLHPEDGAEGSGEVNAFNSSEHNESFGKSGMFGITPFARPFGFCFDARDGGQALEEAGFFCVILDVGVKEEGDVFNKDLKSIEAASLGALNLLGEVGKEVFVHNTIGACKKGKNVRQEVSFFVGEFFPVIDVFGQVDFFWEPNRRVGLFDFFPELKVQDRVEYVSVWVRSKDGFHGKCTVSSVGRRFPFWERQLLLCLQLFVVIVNSR